ncbi:unnamed protein product [Protopolystoma xenopodis]|uniref:Uncharacterized protein n=1 Tax=Protopolystoma xenopodis TaxID=117903 RepID=A0A448WIQ7_9PLAT|nr:unnamed protein product [Protopolystoma xenopodis]
MQYTQTSDELFSRPVPTSHLDFWLKGVETKRVSGSGLCSDKTRVLETEGDCLDNLFPSDEVAWTRRTSLAPSSVEKDLPVDRRSDDPACAPRGLGRMSRPTLQAGLSSRLCMNMPAGGYYNVIGLDKKATANGQLAPCAASKLLSPET